MELKDITTTVSKLDLIQNADYEPNFNTFPMSDGENTTEITGIYEPSLEDIKVCKDWVDFKEM